MVELSLIVSTLDRAWELERLLSSLSTQTDQNFELIVVDQNEDDRVLKVLDQCGSSFPIKYTTSAKGVSRGRNTGAKMADGHILGFPDDDCWYSPEITGDVVDKFLDPNLHGLAGKCTDPELKRDVYTYATERQTISTRNVPSCVSASALFIRKSMFDGSEGFGELIGPGSGTIWGAMEEHELVYRMLSGGGNLRYFPDIKVFHAVLTDAVTPSKARLYAGGLGLINCLYPKVSPGIFIGLSRSLLAWGARIVTAQPARAAINMAAFKGRLYGYQAARKEFF